jgi:hypothetical protein
MSGNNVQDCGALVYAATEGIFSGWDMLNCASMGLLFECLSLFFITFGMSSHATIFRWVSVVCA